MPSRRASRVTPAYAARGPRPPTAAPRSSDTSDEAEAHSRWIIETAAAHIAAHGRSDPFGPARRGYEALDDDLRVAFEGLGASEVPGGSMPRVATLGSPPRTGVLRGAPMPAYPLAS